MAAGDERRRAAADVHAGTVDVRRSRAGQRAAEEIELTEGECLRTGDGRCAAAHPEVRDALVVVDVERAAVEDQRAGSNECETGVVVRSICKLQRRAASAAHVDSAGERLRAAIREAND